MKLYSANLSPFASRVRVAIYAKGLEVELPPPPGGGLGSPEYRAINPMGKTPCLVTDSGLSVPESTVILEYLEEAYPEPPLLPRSPEDRARVRLIARIVEVYVDPHGGRLFRQLDPAGRDPAELNAALEKLFEALGYLDQHLGDDGYAFGRTLTLADCVLAPFMFYLGFMAQGFERPEILTRYARIGRYREALGRDPVVSRVWGEIAAAVKLYQETRRVT